jgi:hypothetical protein
LLFYKAGTGEFWKTDGQGEIAPLGLYNNWRTTWTHIIPGNFGGNDIWFTDLLFYEAATGIGEFWSTNGQGGMTLLKQHNMRTTWTHIIPGNFGGSGFTDLLFYEAATGTGEFWSTNGQGGMTLLKQHNMRTTWTHIIPGNFGGSGFTDLLFYEAATGTGEFWSTNGQGGMTLLKQHNNWRTNWTHIIPGNFGDNRFTDLLFYKAATGAIEFWSTNGQGEITLLKRHKNWRTTWTHIIPGNFGGNGFTDLLFYDPYPLTQGPIRPYMHVRRSQPLGAPEAIGAPSGIVFPALGVTNIVYRSTNGQLHELRQNGVDFSTRNLTQLANNAIRAIDEPTSYIDTMGGFEIALYRGEDSHVHSLYWSNGVVRRDALSGTAGAPPAASTPVGFVQRDGTNVVIYRSEDGHLRDLWWIGTNTPSTEDLTALSSAPEATATGDPSPYINTNTGENIVAYCGTDGYIHTLYWTTGAVGHDNLSDIAGSPRAAGDPVAYYTSHNDAHQITYRSHDGRLHELWWNGNNSVNHWVLTTEAIGAPPAASDPAAYYSAGTNTKHVIYRGEDGHLNEIWWVPGGGIPAHVDLTLRAFAPLATGKPAAFTVEGANSQHVVYRGTDGHIHEIRWT